MHALAYGTKGMIPGLTVCSPTRTGRGSASPAQSVLPCAPECESRTLPDGMGAKKAENYRSIGPKQTVAFASVERRSGTQLVHQS